MHMSEAEKRHLTYTHKQLLCSCRNVSCREEKALRRILVSSKVELIEINFLQREKQQLFRDNF